MVRRTVSSISTSAVEEPTVEEITYKRRKKKRSKEELLKDLPVERIDYHLSDEEQVCPQCDSFLNEMSTEVRKELKIIPAQVKVVEHVQRIYSCRQCEKVDIKTPIIKAQMPKPAIPGSLASSSLIAFIMDKKYTEGMPLYRQEQAFKRYGIELSRQNFSNWMIKGAEWFEVLYERMHELLLKEEVLHADETTVQVLKESGKAPQTKSYMWLYRTGRYSKPIVLYNYQSSRSGDHPKKFLEEFSGYLHVDGYSGYNKLSGNITRIGCFAHARRGFSDALKAMGKNKKNKVSRTIANKGFKFFNQLYKIEHKIKDLSPDDRLKNRLEYSQDILDDFLVWLKESKEKVLPKSKLGEAIKYCLNQWPNLINYLKDGRLEIDNNRAERSIKPFVMGRKAFLFSNTPKGAKSSAIIYSIIETAKENKLKPFNYLTYLLDQLPNINIEDQNELDKLLPWSKSLPEEFKLNK